MENNQVQQDLASIRNLMERSSKFLSLSGLSGILAGVYALVGAYLAYRVINPFWSATYDQRGEVDDLLIIEKLLLIAVVVLGASLATGLILSMRKARRTGQKFWNAGSKALIFNMSVPLLTGGALMLVFVWQREYWGIVAPASLIFYGLALVGAGNYTYKGVQYLGINEILLGLIAAIYPGYGLYFWAFGFGVLHIVYGSFMYIKYDR
ncbi:hypothetical protein [Mucilaginibacter myungsuensis]|uniref:Uncharacterized protein n=1 Tax=Mucilaginibacter myungsuensis TaxID=649104 RepID=A0A929PXB4_9SPHI|nr:hypothetical protein [Mucilaginibacter myungsuensis]MBE9662225.1 hypothetical protein [Mucilaginibacter myungsuensis]MDN3599339.1 hypothetical protein [Mucilaginibacter myungsuensis]